MQKRTIKVAILAALAIILVLSFSSVALADQTWSDLPDTVTAKYDITDNQVAAISDGFVGGLWKPYQAVTRAQFTKMAVAAFKIPMADPATASYTDVAKGSPYYQYIEGAKAAGMINGVGGGLFSPNASITRQQAIAIVSRYIAKVNGYDLATMYTATEIDNLLAHFADKASISADLKKEVAFAFDMGITEGNAAGNVAPLANLTRIQGAAFLIRATAKIPPANWTAANIELVSDDKSENLIGKTHQVTFKVTTADGHPAAGVLVDFDSIFANPLYVGNISPQAAMTNGAGEVTVNLISTEPGTQRLSAAVAGVAAIYTTKYWVAMDEVYIRDLTREAENNAGDEHTWTAQVIVLGPGPRSTSQFDWYNVIDDSFDPADLQLDDGRWVDINSYNDEVANLAPDEMVRGMAGIGVDWTVDWTGLADPSKGTIVSKDVVTDADGQASITIKSTSIGTAEVTAMAWYAENPYPQMLIDRDTAHPDDWEANDDWEAQPSEFASATKLWIPHVIGGDSDAPITPLYAVNNTGEVETFVLDLKDVYGNPIAGYSVEWWIQGAGFFKTDGSTWVGIGEQNKDIDVTDAAGEAAVSLKSLTPGQTIVHCKVMDKYGLPWKEWNVVKQWYSIDSVSLGYFDENGDFYDAGDTAFENVVDTGHDWVAGVAGAKYVYSLYDINKNGLRDDEVLIGDRQDLKDAKGMVKDMAGGPDFWKDSGEEILPGQAIYIGDWGKQTGAWYTRFADIQLAANEFWMDGNDDGVEEIWAGLAGKTVYFFNNVGRGSDPASNTPMETIMGDGYPEFVGTITSEDSVVTDENGFAPVSINSLNKGYQYVYAVADYKDNPQDGDPLKPLDWAELRWDVATKLWIPAGGDSTVIFGQGQTDDPYRFVNPVLDWTRPLQGTNPNFETIAVQVFDTYGNALEGYKVTWEVVGQGTTTAGDEPTYHPFAHFANPAHEDAGVGDLHPFVNSNWWWGAKADGLGPQATPDNADADWAWGHTQNHMINFETSLVSAAHVDLVMDETAGELAARAEDHFTNIVNIKVYYPESEGGGLFDEFEVTKVWDMTPPALTTLNVQVATSATGPWVSALTSSISPLYYRVQLLDQYGDPWLSNTNVDLKITGPFNDTYQGIDVTGAVDPDGYTAATILPAFTAAGLHTIIAYYDSVTVNDQLSPGEESSAPATVTVP